MSKFNKAKILFTKAIEFVQSGKAEAAIDTIKMAKEKYDKVTESQSNTTGLQKVTTIRKAEIKYLRTKLLHDKEAERILNKLLQNDVIQLEE